MHSHRCALFRQHQPMNQSPQLSELSALERVHLLPADAPLTSSEAAIFLRISLSTLERMRRDGSGPVYLQSGRLGSKGTNQKCRYFRADLLDYLRSTRVTHSMAAAVRKGQVAGGMPGVRGFSSWDSLRVKQPFFIIENDVIQRDVESAHMEEILMGLGRRRIAWMDPAEAVTGEWGSLESFEEFASKVGASLHEIMGEMTDVRGRMLAAVMNREIERQRVF